MRRYYKNYYQQRTALDESEILEGLSAKLQQDVAQFLIGEIMVQVPVFNGIVADQWARVLPCFKVRLTSTRRLCKIYFVPP